ncbi:MAG: hypothetical protein V3V95_00280 [Thermodesulfobacteriota bacterium]
MASNILIVMIENKAIRARVLGPVQGGEGEERRSRVFETTMGSVKGALKDSMSVLLEEMEHEGFSNFDRFFLGLPGHLTSLRVLTLPFTDAAKTEEVLPFELGDSLVEDPIDLVFGALPLQGGRTLAVTIEKKVIESTLKSFEELGLVPQWLGLPLLNKDRLLKELHKESSTAALVDKTSITVLNEGTACHYGYINDPIDLKFVLAVLEGEGIIVEHFYLTDMATDWIKGIEGIGLPDAEYVHTTNYVDEDTGLSALAMLAADSTGGTGGAGGKGTLNFRKGEFIDKRIYESAKRSFRVATILIILVACFWSVNIYTRLQRPVKETARIEGSLFNVFSEIFPGGAALDPLYQIQIKLKELRKEKEFVEGGIDVLELLNGLSRGVSIASDQADSAEVRLFELKMHEKRVVARGETSSFDHADRFKDRLQASPDYKDISLTDVKSKVDGRVSFSIALTLKGDG